MGELEAGGGELGGVGAGAGEEDFIGHFTACQAESEAWDREKCRAVELGGECANELLICGWIGGREVNGAGESRRVEEKQDGSRSVLERDPAHVLMSAAEPATEAEAEEGEHPGESALARAEDNTEAEMEDTDAGIDGGFGCCFPMLTALGEKTGAEGRGFVDEFVAAIAVNACCRGDEERPGWMAEAGKCSGKGAGGVYTACGNFAFVIGSPPVGGKVSAGEMDGGSEVFEALGVTNLVGGGGVPLELVGLSGGGTDELDDGGATRNQGFPEGLAEQS